MIDKGDDNINNHITDKKILLTGGAGFLGSKVHKFLKEEDPDEIIIPRSKENDLRDKHICSNITKGIDTVIHLAARVGGIGYNMKNPGNLFYDNLMMGLNLIEESRKNNVEKFVAVGTICAYPKYTPVPFKEEDFWIGYPEETNAPYGLAKKMLLVQLQAYRKQYDFNGIYLLPVNLYGPGDNFDPKSSHVIPALIKKVIDAKEKGKDRIEVWGTGKATREFFYVDDAARGIILASKKYNKSDPVNLGSGIDISIKKLAELICNLCEFDGRLNWDISKPDGQPKRRLDISKAKKEFGFTPKVELEDGLKITIEWHINNKKIINC